jgi:hypothetical protein
MLDYAGGYGRFSSILKKYFDLNMPVYDPYVKNQNFNNYIDIDKNSSYTILFNSALLEHIFSKKVLDNINSLVDNKSGVLILHTVICENIPKDKNWFYLEPPVHTTFHTNKSMSIFMKQNGYKSSIYCPLAKSWILFKKTPLDIENTIDNINNELQSKYFIYKKGFVDYWKGF